MVKPLTFKGEKKPKKRKRAEPSEESGQNDDSERQLKVTKAEEANEGEDDGWVLADVVTDINGPVMFVLPTEPPTALACDVNGKVFTLPIENIVDNNPITAEPHDVRQVWVANKIVGTDHFRFKGHHGKYLACDKIGLFSANSDAITPIESFNVIATADTPGTFQIQTLRDTFLSVRASRSSKANAPPEVRGDETEITFDTTLRIRMQARFKPKLKASKEEKAREKISRRELEEAVGRRLEDDEVKKLKKARREGNYHEALLDLKVKGKHDKYS
ncbi:protein frg1 [Cladorrhinum sp. PSN259]|nr:protein frg1 [Cladorrhinum sp. PSN259]